LSPAGLRERKKQKTKEAIQREAMRLFLERGYEETTIEQIADAAEISPSTFFNYFPTKEDVVLFDRYDPMLLSMLAHRPADEPVSASLRVALEGLDRVMEQDRDMIFARAKLGLETPALRARFWEELEKARELIAGVVAARTGRSPHDYELRVLSMVVVIAAFEASQEWLRNGGRGSLMKLVDQAMDVIGAWQHLDELARGTSGRGSPPAG
jgi:AcrR family transcriptional regulator